MKEPLQFHKSKKGISEMVGYVLLVIIAVGLSVLVYSFLSLYTPKEKFTCEGDISLVVQDYSCDSPTGILNITLLNKGLFKVDAVYVRASNSSRQVRTILPKLGMPAASANSKQNLIINGSSGLQPDESIKLRYNTDEVVKHNPGQYTLEIQPALISKGQISLCKNSIINPPIDCN